ncbi:cohesin domain-containing protein [Geoglobus sp.]
MIVRFLVLSLLVIATIGTASALTVKLPNATGSIGSSVEVAVEVEDARDLGSMDVVIAYDPSVVEVKSVGKGELNKGLLSSNTGNGMLAISLADSRGISGNGAVAIIVFDTLKEGESALKIQSVKAYDVNTHVDLRVEKQDGKLVVSGVEEEKKNAPGFEIWLVAVVLAILASRRRGK